VKPHQAVHKLENLPAAAFGLTGPSCRSNAATGTKLGSSFRKCKYGRATTRWTLPPLPR
jgi:hypothetical protein